MILPCCAHLTYYHQQFWTPRGNVAADHEALLNCFHCIRLFVGAWLSLARAPGSGPGGRWFKSTRPDHYFPSRFIALRRVLLHGGKLQTRYIRYNIGGLSRNLKSQADFVCHFSSILHVFAELIQIVEKENHTLDPPPGERIVSKHRVRRV